MGGSSARIESKVYARVGLFGNPSDGYNGRTIAFSLENFFAIVQLTPSDSINIKENPSLDHKVYSSLADLSESVQSLGYYGATRLLLAICHKFFQYCKSNNICIDQTRNFTLTYDTNIPRQAGLSGSSALVTACLNCLLKYYQVEDQLAPIYRPQLILDAENDLGIVAGLMDRVIQVFGGIVDMNFSKDIMQTNSGRPKCKYIPCKLPQLYAIYNSKGSDSGKIHSNVKKRWLDGDSSISNSMSQCASIAQRAGELILNYDNGKIDALKELIRENFQVRCSLFSPEKLGYENIDMVTSCESVGAAAKFTGSGGAVIVLGTDNEIEKLKVICQEKGWNIVKAQIGVPNFHEYQIS